MTPFKVVYGRDPPSLLDYISSTSRTEAVDQLLSDRQTLLQLLKSNLLKAQSYMKKSADGRRRDEHFQVGDIVWVKLQHYRQLYVATSAFHKLSLRYFGPFPILKWIGQVAYKLELPLTARIHNVFRVSLLKPYRGDHPIETRSLPKDITNSHPVLEPQHVLQFRRITNKDKEIAQVLIQWQGMSISDATLENVDTMRVDFPNFNLEDKVVLNGGGIDMNGPMGVEEASDMLAKVQREDSMVENEKMS